VKKPERILPLLLAWSVVAGALPSRILAQDNTQAGLESPEDLRRLVAPIALYPDALVAQILAAATYPVQIVEAHRWLDEHPGLTGGSLAAAVDSLSWDPSVKALTQFPSVLADLDKNLSWTSALGDAYINQPQDVLDAVQAMRNDALQAGHLETTPQQDVTVQEGVVVIEPRNPDIVYVPVFDPCTVYGVPWVFYPGWVTGCIPSGPVIVFGVGIHVGWPAGPCCVWRWPAWHTDWRARAVTYNHHPYVSRTTTFVDRRAPNRAPPAAPRPRAAPAPTAPRVAPARPVTPRSSPADRGFGPARGQTGTRSGVFSGFGQGGSARGSAARGRTSAGAPPRPQGHPTAGAPPHPQGAAPRRK